MGDHLCISFSNNRNCLCQISSKTLSGRLQQSMDSLVSLKLTTRTGTCYVTASHVSASSTSSIDINGLYANKLSLSEGEKVYAEIIDCPTTASRVAIEPVSVDDWEILELNAEYIQSELLNQIRVVWTGLVLPIWVSGSICIFIKVGWMEPDTTDYMQLDQLTELVISPKGRQRVLGRAQSNQISSSLQGANQNASGAAGDNPSASSPTADTIIRHGVVDKQHTSGSIRSSLQFDTSLQPVASAAEGAEATSRSTAQEGSQNVIYGVLRRWLPAFLTPENSPTDGTVAIPGTGSMPTTASTQWRESQITPVVCRVLTCRLHKLNSWWSKYPSIGVVNKSQVPEATSAHFLAELCLLLSPIEVEAEAKLAAKFRRRNQRTTPPTKTERHVGTVCVVVRDADDATLTIPAGHVMLDEMFCKLHRIKLTSKVRLGRVTSQHSKIATIQIQPTHSVPEFMNKERMLVAFRNYLRTMASIQGYPLQLLSSNTLNIEIAAGSSADFLVLAFPTEQQKSSISPTASEEKEGADAAIPNYFLLHEEDLMDVSVNCEEIITNRCQFSVIPDGMVSADSPKHLPVGYPQLHHKLVNFVQCSLQCRTEGGLLLTGSRGTGKTTLANSVLHHVVKHWHCYTHSIDSTQLRGKRPDAIKKLLDSTIQECIWRQPSVLFIDDLDALCKAAAGPEEEASPEIVYSSKISEVLRDRLGSMWRQRVQVAVIATSISRASLNPKLTATHGLHVFHLTEDIPSLSQTCRCSMLKSIMHSLGVKSIPSDDQLMSHTDKLEGYVVRDLVAVVKRAAHAHTIFSGDNPTTRIDIKDLDASLEGFTPASLRGVALHSPGENTWKDVGGLHNIKEQLVRMLEWPAKYRKLYAQCPIRLQSGVLLYGAPGTGKTLVAAVVAKEMGLNFISIKGPELLNKYIGASEQGVRDTFRRAQDVKPCILFFDEFESLAPRRGHDSTGVTDRVVNQLLTQLDGVEALEGVYVLAATSRPDLIDPALLRPGRLDKSLCCGIPTADDRLEILQALARHMNIDDDVDLAEVANSCEECTGADLKSLLVNAQLQAVHDLLDNSILYRDSGIVSDANDEDTEELVTGIYKSSIDEEAQPITPQSPCYQQVRRLYSRTSRNALSRRTTPSSDNQVIILQSHIDSALSNLQPSVSREERAKYQFIYEQFTSSKTSRVIGQPDQLITTKQRVSLA